MQDLPVEAELRDLARRFDEVERRVRSLVMSAPTGNRRTLLIQALEELSELRAIARNAHIPVEQAYALAAVALHRLTKQPATDGSKARPLGLSLAFKLNLAVATVEQNTRRAIATVRVENREAAAKEAVTARVSKAGARINVAVESQMLTRTIGRRAVSRATADMFSGGGVFISGGECPICGPLQGEHSGMLEPPFHPSCKCVSTPIGYTPGQHIAAMESAMP